MLGNIEYFFDHLSTNVSQHSLPFIKNDGLINNIKPRCTLHYQFQTRQGKKESGRVYNSALLNFLRHGGLSFLQSIIQLYHIHCTNIGVTYSPHFREEGGLRHHVFLVFFGIRSLWVLACTNIHHLKHSFLPHHSKFYRLHLSISNLLSIDGI